MSSDRWMSVGAKAASVAAMAVMVGTVHGQYLRRDLVSDGFVPAEHIDPNLVNPWGIAPNPAPNGVWWVSDADAGVSTLYGPTGVVNSLVVNIPPAKFGKKKAGSPTGIVFYGGSNFVVTNGVNSGPARFIFASEDGVISGWNPAVPLPPPSTQAQVAHDSSEEAAGYRGLAIASTRQGEFLFVTDFHNNSVEIYDSKFDDFKVDGAFEDPTIPEGFHPFGIQTVGDKVFVTYALKEEDSDEDVTGPGLGYVNVFDTMGRLEMRFASEGVLNAPWGIAKAPANFGPFSNAMLIGNFGDGHINAFDESTGALLGELDDAEGKPFEVEGLWGLHFGTGLNAGPLNSLFFAAGIEDESHGLFGRIDVDAATLADLTHDGVIDGDDLGDLLAAWKSSENAADLNGDGTVNGADLGLLLANWSG